MKIKAESIEPRKIASVYPEELAAKMKGREKRALGDHFDIKKFGVNHTTLQPGARSALLHKHSKQEEFVYILTGTPTLVTSEGRIKLSPGECSGFTPQGPAHYLLNESEEVVTYLEMGDRITDDMVTYPEDDLKATLDSTGKWIITRKDGSHYN